MTISFDPTSDVTDVVDGVEAVELRRRDTGESVSIATALCRSQTVSEAEPSGGIAQQADAEWYLQLPTGETDPGLGDVVIDTMGHHWTVLEAEQQSLLGRWKCSTRELRIASGCDQFVDVQRAVWADLGEGPVIVSWNDVYTALPVRIQPSKKEASDTSNMPVVTEQFTIILGDAFPIESDDRFVGTDGSIYRLESHEQAERIDKLPIANVIKTS